MRLSLILEVKKEKKLMKSGILNKTSQVKKYITLTRIVTFGEFVLLALGVLTAFLFYSHYEKVLGNTASRLLLALGPHLKLGRPYTDLWEFAPPGFLAITDLWIRVFGWSMNSLKLLQVLLLSTAGVSFLLILRRLFRFLLLELIIFSSFVLILYSPVLQSDMLSIELFGLTFALLGLLSLLYIQKPVWKLMTSAFLFFLASQMKETFTFSILALIPYLIVITKKFWRILIPDSNFLGQLGKNTLFSYLKMILLTILGPLIGAAIIFTYLTSVDALSGYKQVFEYKLSLVKHIRNIGDIIARFKFVESLFSENFLHWHHYTGRLLILNIIIVYYRYFRIKISKPTKYTIGLFLKIKRGQKGTWTDWSAIFFSLGLFVGVIMYGQFSVDTRQVPVAAAFFILTGVLLKTPLGIVYNFLKDRSSVIVANAAIGIFLFLFLFPQTRIIKSFFNQIQLHISGEVFKNEESRKYYFRSPSYEVTDYIASRTSPEDCILNAYGWEVAETYIYSQRKPCSRHFLANLVIQNDWQIEEYKKQILNNPPEAIFYNLNIIDLNVENFETKVINYSDVLKHCYYLDSKYRKFPYVIMSSVIYIDIYWKRIDMNEEEFMSCFQKYAQKDLGDLNNTK